MINWSISYTYFWKMQPLYPLLLLYIYKINPTIPLPIHILAMVKMDMLGGDILRLWLLWNAWTRIQLLLGMEWLFSILYLVAWLCSPYKSFILRSMYEGSMFSCYLCNSLLIKVSMMHLVVMLSSCHFL